MRRFSVFLAVLSLVFMLACSGGKKETVYEYPDGDSDDTDISDVEISDEDSSFLKSENWRIYKNHNRYRQRHG